MPESVPDWSGPMVCVNLCKPDDQDEESWLVKVTKAVEVEGRRACGVERDAGAFGFVLSLGDSRYRVTVHFEGPVVGGRGLCLRA